MALFGADFHNEVWV